MIRFVHLEKRFEKELEALRTGGEKGAAAAKKADELLEALTRNGPPDLKKVGKLTGWGEKRVEGCIKYDLGSGFRMICFRRGETLFVSYIGTHDDCHNWLDRYCGRHNWVAKKTGTNLPIQSAGPPDWRETTPSDEDLGDDFDDFLLDQIDDKIFRKIFNGLCNHQED